MTVLRRHALICRLLQQYARELKEVTTHKYRPRWMTYNDDAEALQDFVSKTTKAIVSYQVSFGYQPVF